MRSAREDAVGMRMEEEEGGQWAGGVEESIERGGSPKQARWELMRSSKALISA